MAASILSVNLPGKYICMAPSPTLRHLRPPVRDCRRSCTLKALSLSQPPEFPRVPPDSEYPPKPPLEMPNTNPVPGFEPNFPNEVPEVRPSPELEETPPNIDPPLTPPPPSPVPHVPQPPDLVPPVPGIPLVPDDVPPPAPPQSPPPPAPPEGSPTRPLMQGGCLSHRGFDSTGRGLMLERLGMVFM
ncbi:proline-rich receptor-like protein kinase PERK2 [Nymphaea colorata]|uniref:proline-rich receptor-like protein kinase PERK2 n=1 Tax=Nymphaea colorata TaxID=210225 RepID=UPI00129D903D|nr:proline-rich receptor-like protein kinase PERK2 [Nymphaea colorata]